MTGELILLAKRSDIKDLILVRQTDGQTNTEAELETLASGHCFKVNFVGILSVSVDLSSALASFNHMGNGWYKASLSEIVSALTKGNSNIDPAQMLQKELLEPCCFSEAAPARKVRAAFTAASVGKPEHYGFKTRITSRGGPKHTIFVDKGGNALKLRKVE